MATGYQGDSGWGSLQGLGRHSGLIGALLISVGAMVSLAMGITRVRRLGLWLIPTVLFTTGVLLVARPRTKS